MRWRGPGEAREDPAHRTSPTARRAGYASAAVNRSPNNMATRGMAADHFGEALFYVAVLFSMAKKINFCAASSLGNNERVLMTFLIPRLSPSMQLVV